ncbi:MAG: PSD1 and planctomycete cytochrome C domain-containing protein [Pirellulales bacterium]
MRSSIYLFIWTGAILLAAQVTAQEPAARRYSYNRDIRPILSDKCFACHGFDAKQRQANLRLDQADGAYGSADSGKHAVVPGRLEQSQLWQRVQSSDSDIQMPPKESHKSLTDGEKVILRQWIVQGAEYQGHWAFEAIAIPKTKLSIDDWTERPLKELGLSFSPEADRPTLLRRLSLDLTGLPPTPEEIDAFVNDSSTDAWEKQVERLLQSTGYGERMAMMWLDVSRYGDTNGYLHDILRTGWPWRDWVIQSFQQDKPFNQFVIEQLAGDLLENATPEQVLATAFCRNHLITTEGGTLAAEFLNEYAADRVQTFGTAFLGLSLNCCRCHDHKFDPFTQEDFYSLQSFFNSITEKHSENNSASAYEPFIETASPLEPDGEKVKVMIMREAAEPTKTFVLTRGQYDLPDASRPVSRKVPAIFRRDGKEVPATRLGLAQWLTSNDNPLLARVIVNRLWQKFFARGLVQTVDDFGAQGDYPTHPELLDQLAYQFQHSDQFGAAHAWSIKSIVRQIVTSKTYRQSARVRGDLLQKDPENRLLGYFPRQRLTGEELRDQAIFVAGALSSKLGGPPVYPYQPDGLWEERANEGSNTKVYKRSEPTGLYRKSLYTFWKRTCPPPLMTLFDAPDRTYCTVKRSTTNTPLQALALLNEEQFLECAKLLAVRTMAEQSEQAGDDRRINSIMKRLTGRELRPQELEWTRSLLNQSRARFSQSPDDAKEILQQGVSTVPAEYATTETAAWMVVANALLNLDEVLVKN